MDAVKARIFPWRQACRAAYTVEKTGNGIEDRMEQKNITAMKENGIVPSRLNIGTQDDEIDLVEVFFTLVAHWKSLLLCFLIGAVLLGAYHTRFVKIGVSGQHGAVYHQHGFRDFPAGPAIGLGTDGGLSIHHYQPGCAEPGDQRSASEREL